MADSNIEKSFDTLKLTIPQLLKHKVSAEPTNYALWYTYVLNESPDLKSAMDQIVDNDLQWSEVKTKELYRKHIADTETVSAWELRQSVEAMIVELSQSLKDTHSETARFKDTMDNCVDDLAKIEKEGLSVEEVMALVRNLVKDTQNIRRSTISFNAALTDAQNEIQALRSQLEQSQQEALYDALTGLCNRRYFDEELAAQSLNPKLSLMIVDLDHFKKVNDTYGHQAGDEVIRVVSRLLRESLRKTDIAGRYGGEEFGIILGHTTADNAFIYCERLRKAIEETTVTHDNIDIKFTVSLGICEASKKLDDYKEWLEKTDQALYQCKETGRNKTTIFDLSTLPE